jgi:hypothetical protein
MISGEFSDEMDCLEWLKTNAKYLKIELPSIYYYEEINELV